MQLKIDILLGLRRKRLKLKLGQDKILCKDRDTYMLRGGRKDD